jgi:hypothetical protein
VLTSKDTKRKSDSADKSNSADKSKKKSKSGDSDDKTKADKHDTPIDAEKLALKEAIKALTAHGAHDTGLIEITGIKGTGTRGAIGFACIYDGDESLVHVNEITEKDKAEFALSVARWLKQGGLGGQYDHKAGVVRDLDHLLDSILGKGNGPRLTDRICVQAPNNRTPLSPRFLAFALSSALCMRKPRPRSSGPRRFPAVEPRADNKKGSLSFQHRSCFLLLLAFIPPYHPAAVIKVRGARPRAPPSLSASTGSQTRRPASLQLKSSLSLTTMRRPRRSGSPSKPTASTSL